MFTATSISNIVEKNRELWGKISHDYELKTDPGRVSYKSDKSMEYRGIQMVNDKRIWII